MTPTCTRDGLAELLKFEAEPACWCRFTGTGNAISRPGVVLDPFMGAGTVALAAEQYRRDWLGIELNPEYMAMAEKRITSQRAAREKQGSKAIGEKEKVR